MGLKEDLIAAKALIDAPEKWKRGSLGVDTCFCAMGAIGKVLRDQGRQYFWISATPQYKALAAALPNGRNAAVPAFNDDPNTTHADVMALFDRAIEAAQ